MPILVKRKLGAKGQERMESGGLRIEEGSCHEEKGVAMRSRVYSVTVTARDMTRDRRAGDAFGGQDGRRRCSLHLPDGEFF